MSRYTVAVEGGLLTEQDKHYLIQVKNFRDPVGAPLGASREQYLGVGITKRFVAKMMAERNLSMIGRIFGILPVEMLRITSAHLGLQRPLRHEQDGDADGKVVVVVMHPTEDVTGLLQDDGSISIKQHTPPTRQNFVALLSSNKQKSKYPDVEYWLEHCNWVDADPDAPKFPVDYMSRYEKACIWVG